jgi:hypothetical protein
MRTLTRIVCPGQTSASAKKVSPSSTLTTLAWTGPARGLSPAPAGEAPTGTASKARQAAARYALAVQVVRIVEDFIPIARETQAGTGGGTPQSV